MWVELKISSLIFTFRVFSSTNACRLIHDKRLNLQLYEMPQLTIPPKRKCEMSTVVTIDIQPDDSVRRDHRSHQSQNLKIVYCTHASTDGQITNGTESFRKSFPAEEERKKTVTPENKMAEPAGVNQNNALTDLLPNKYYTPFLRNSNAQKRPTFASFDEDILQNNDTSSSLVDSVSINLSSSSILSDPFAYDTVRKRNVSKTRKPIESILRDIFDSITPPSETPAQEVTVQPAINTEALQLRDLLEKIRNDKTSLDLAIERRNTMAKLSNSELLESPNAQQIKTESINESVQKASSPQDGKDYATDKSVQCDNLDGTTGKVEDADRNNDRMFKRRAKTRPIVKYDTNDEWLRAPNVAKTLNSIRSSARNLNYDSENGKYKSATPEQIQRAADKFLNSLIKSDRLSRQLSRRDGDSDSDSLNSYILVPPKYRVIDDKVIQSQYNSILLEHPSGPTSDSTVDSMLPKRAAKSGDETNASTSSNSFDLRLSNMQLCSPLRRNSSTSESNGYISDGEVLSEGEVRPDER